MLSHVTIGVADLGRAKAFYDRVIATLGIGCVVDEPDHGLVGYAESPTAAPQFYLIRPIDGQPAGVGNGQTFAFLAQDHATVDRFHAEGLAAGGRDEGAPGLRPHYHPNYYGAYLRDLDGHKIACVCHRSEG
ncbi:MAG: VOC family protein [Rhodospirillales bacterium]|nr:MAG: VOC family protein [Rhodospirillales bacterium]